MFTYLIEALDEGDHDKEAWYTVAQPMSELEVNDLMRDFITNSHLHRGTAFRVTYTPYVWEKEKVS